MHMVESPLLILGVTASRHDPSPSKWEFLKAISEAFDDQLPRDPAAPPTGVQRGAEKGSGRLGSCTMYGFATFWVLPKPTWGVSRMVHLCPIKHPQ